MSRLGLGCGLGIALAVSASAGPAYGQPEAPPLEAPPASAPEDIFGSDAPSAPAVAPNSGAAPAPVAGAADSAPDARAGSAPSTAETNGGGGKGDDQKAGDAKKKPSEKKLGPYEIEIDKGNSVGIGFGGQIRTTVTDKDNGPTKSRETLAEVVVRRLRFILSGSFLDKKLKASAQLNLVPGQIELIDLYASYKFIDEVQLQLGQFKIPYTRYRNISWSRLQFPDWSLVTQHFGSERQMGVMLHNGGKDDTPFSYAFGTFTGTNARASFEKGLAQSYGESLPNPSDLADPALPEELHPEFAARFSHQAKDIDSETNSDWRHGPFRHLVSVSAAWDVQPVLTRDFLVRLSPELLLKWRGLSATVVGYFGFFEDRLETAQFGSWGINAEVGWRITELVELAWRFAHVDQTDALRNDAKARAEEILAAASEDDLEDLEKQYSAAGKVTAEQEIAMGLNLYFVGNSVKWQNDMAYLRKDRGETRDGEPDARHDIRARMQLLVSF